MMCPDETCEGFRLAIPSIVDRGRQSTRAASPVVEGDEVEVFVERALRLLVDHAEDLGYCGVPWMSVRVDVMSIPHS